MILVGTYEFALDQAIEFAVDRFFGCLFVHTLGLPVSVTVFSPGFLYTRLSFQAR